MRLAVVGSRSFCDYKTLEETLDKYISEKGIEVDEIVSGGARGADSLAEKYCRDHDIPVRVISPQWHIYGKKAGVVRNREIVRSSDSVVAFYDGKSRGTLNTITTAARADKLGAVFDTGSSL